jgi:hypothetical protein
MYLPSATARVIRPRISGQVCALAGGPADLIAAQKSGFAASGACLTDCQDFPPSSASSKEGLECLFLARR